MAMVVHHGGSEHTHHLLHNLRAVVIRTPEINVQEMIREAREDTGPYLQTNLTLDVAQELWIDSLQGPVLYKSLPTTHMCTKFSIPVLISLHFTRAFSIFQFFCRAFFESI